LTIEPVKQWQFGFTRKPRSKVGDQSDVSRLVMIGFPFCYYSLTEQVETGSEPPPSQPPYCRLDLLTILAANELSGHSGQGSSNKSRDQ
jgi:hypothetical protein